MVGLRRVRGNQAARWWQLNGWCWYPNFLPNSEKRPYVAHKVRNPGRSVSSLACQCEYSSVRQCLDELCLAGVPSLTRDVIEQVPQ